jgi:hypothetical protein
MHNIEPYYNWRHLYTPEEDKQSPFYGKSYSEFEYTQTIYNYFIHPQWDDYGSQTLYIKVLFCDYEQGYVIIETIGEWNDAIENDIMILKREIIDQMIDRKITKFILIGENVLNFHSSDDCYYEEWYDDIEDKGGWIIMLNLPSQSGSEFLKAGIQYYINFFDFPSWRTHAPSDLFIKMDNLVLKKLNS